jgi:exopolysaccharide production protein ExoQ
MLPRIASVVYSVGILGLFYLDRDRKARTSPAVWIPAAWMFIGASRMISQWLGAAPSANTPDVYLDGSPMDAAILTALLVGALVVLLVRGPRTAAFLRANKWILLFFLYCSVSIVWSDFPLVAFKRWTKSLGNLAMVFVVLTDANPTAALKQLFARTGFLLIPISMLLIKYYPDLGRGYNHYTWTTFYQGVATDKNGLGVICLIWGLVSVWRLVEAYRSKRSSSRTRSLIAHGVLLLVNLWVLQMADSSTSLSCLVMGTALLLITSRNGTRRPATIHRLVGTIAVFSLIFYVFDDAWASIVHLLGRETNLTGRTDIWNDVLQLHVNPILGTGFESFWLGARAEFFWKKYQFHPNQAHNGYLETYLNLGWIGVGLLLLLIIVGYRNVINAYLQRLPSATLQLSLLLVAVVYNMTEATFKVMHPMYIAFLFAIIRPPRLSLSTNDSPTIPDSQALTQDLMTDTASVGQYDKLQPVQ